MKYNVVSILVDSVSWDCISTHRTKVSVTPFLDSLQSESITASNLYSQGPYTDAATKSLYTGRDCLDDFAYYSKLNSAPSNHFKAFHDEGYETFGFYYPYYMIGSGIKKYIDHSFYTSGFAFVSEWGGIYSYYAEAVKNRNLTQDEYLILEDHFILMFDVWKSFYQEVLENPSSATLIIVNIGDFDINNALGILTAEENKFKKEPKAYIDNFLRQGRCHLLNTLDRIDIDAAISRVKLRQLYKEEKYFFWKVFINNIRANLWRNRPKLSRIWFNYRRYMRTGDDNCLFFIKNYTRCLRSILSFKRRSLKPLWQFLPSARKEMEGAISSLKERRTNKPFFLSMHVLDPHAFINFFSYDMLDQKDVIDEEFAVMKQFVDELGPNFIGDLSYYLSLRYSDYCLERFCNSLKEMGVWDETVLLIFADHGSSYSYYPLHNNAVNCFDDECYHVPMTLRIPNLEGKVIDSYHNAKDMFPTLFDCLGIDKPVGFKGSSMLDDTIEKKGYVMTEYMGPGCPDILSRRIWFSIRDENYLVAFKVGIWENFESGELCEVYDLNKDPLAYQNVNDTIERSEIEYLLNQIRDRYNEVKIETSLFMNKLREKYQIGQMN